jgi:hypothetical protein
MCPYRMTHEDTSPYENASILKVTDWTSERLRTRLFRVVRHSYSLQTQFKGVMELMIEPACFNFIDCVMM